MSVDMHFVLMSMHPIILRFYIEPQHAVSSTEYKHAISVRDYVGVVMSKAKQSKQGMLSK